jgi:hypothetical protein
MAITSFAYTPTDNIANETTYVTTPTSETAARAQFKDIFDQIQNGVNAIKTALESTATGSSGASCIKLETVVGLAATDVQGAIEELKTALAEGVDISSVIGEGEIERAMLEADAVDGTKLADDSVDSEHIVAGAIDAEHLANDSVTEDAVATGVITANKIANAAVGLAQLAAAVLAIIPRLDGGTEITAAANLNTYVTPGSFKCISDAGAAALGNTPTNAAFLMYVSYGTGGTTGYVKQEIIDRHGRRYMRVTTDTGATWSPWTQNNGMIYGTSATPPVGIYPAGTLYIQHEA